MPGGTAGGHSYRLTEASLAPVVSPGLLPQQTVGRSQMLLVPQQRAHLRRNPGFSFWGRECGRALLGQEAGKLGFESGPHKLMGNSSQEPWRRGRWATRTLHPEGVRTVLS